MYKYTHTHIQFPCLILIECVVCSAYALHEMRAAFVMREYAEKFICFDRVDNFIRMVYTQTCKHLQTQHQMFECLRGIRMPISKIDDQTRTNVNSYHKKKMRTIFVWCGVFSISFFIFFFFFLCVCRTREKKQQQQTRRVSVMCFTKCDLL